MRGDIDLQETEIISLYKPREQTELRAYGIGIKMCFLS